MDVQKIYICFRQHYLINMKYYSLLFILSLLLLTGCGNSARVKPEEIIVFHAGSLSVPFNQLKRNMKGSIRYKDNCWNQPAVWYVPEK